MKVIVSLVSPHPLDSKLLYRTWKQIGAPKTSCEIYLVFKKKQIHIILRLLWCCPTPVSALRRCEQPSLSSVKVDSNEIVNCAERNNVTLDPKSFFRPLSASIFLLGQARDCLLQLQPLFFQQVLADRVGIMAVAPHSTGLSHTADPALASVRSEHELQRAEGRGQSAHSTELYFTVFTKQCCCTRTTYTHHQWTVVPAPRYQKHFVWSESWAIDGFLMSRIASTYLSSRNKGWHQREVFSGCYEWGRLV